MDLEWTECTKVDGPYSRYIVQADTWEMDGEADLYDKVGMEADLNLQTDRTGQELVADRFEMAANGFAPGRLRDKTTIEPEAKVQPPASIIET